MAVPTRSVYVGNIPFTSTEATLLESFAEYEPVSIKVVEGRGVAFVEVPAKRAFNMVRDLDGSKLEGRLLSVSVAKPRENEPTHTQDQEHARRDSQERRPFGNPRFSPREDGPPNDRPPYQRDNRDNRDRPPYQRPDGDRPRFQRDGGRGPDDRPRPYGDRPPFQRNGRPGDRPDRPYNRPGDRPNDRPYNRPNDRPNDRPGDRPGFDRGNDRGGDRPQPYGDRKPFGDRRPFDRNGPPSNGFNRGGDNRGDNRGDNQERPRPTDRPNRFASDSTGPKPFQRNKPTGPGKPRKFFKKR